jgi:hypothetical protein
MIRCGHVTASSGEEAQTLGETRERQTRLLLNSGRESIQSMYGWYK